MDDDDQRPARRSAPTGAEAREEIRQMLEAKSARREARGEEPLDVDAEMAALTRLRRRRRRACARRSGSSWWRATSAACGRAGSHSTWSPRWSASLRDLGA